MTGLWTRQCAFGCTKDKKFIFLFTTEALLHNRKVVVCFPTVSLGISTDVILPAAPWLWSTEPLVDISTGNILWGVFSSKQPNYPRINTQYYSPSVVLEGKFPGKFTSRSCSCTITAPRLAANWKPKTKWLTWASNVFSLYQPPYSTDLSPSDYHLLFGLKKQLKFSYFSSDTKVIANLGTVGRTKLCTFLSSLQSLEQRAKV
jgi:hypothetical protein